MQHSRSAERGAGEYSVISIYLYWQTHQSIMKYTLLTVLLFCFSHAFTQKLVLATYQYAENNRIANIQPLATYLSDSLGLTVEVKSYPTVHAFISGIQGNEVDIALINTFGFLLLETSQQQYKMKPYTVLKVKAGAANNYQTAVLVRKDFPADTITRLSAVASGYRLGLVNIGSTSGNLLPRLKLASVGIEIPEKTFSTVEYCGNHKTAVDMLLANKIDLCAVGSTEYFNLLADRERSKAVKLLWLSSEIPLGPVLLHDRLSASVKQKIISHLLKLDKTSSPTLEAIKAGWSEAKQAEKYIRADKHYYDTFKQQFSNQKALEKILQQFAN